MKLFFERRAATPLAILVLSVMALLLSSIALFIFITENLNLNNKIANVRLIEDAYAKEELVRYYFSQGFDRQEIMNLVEGVKISENNAEIRIEGEGILVIYQIDLSGIGNPQS